MRHHCVLVAALWLAFASGSCAQANEPSLGLKASALAASAVAGGDTGSARLALEPSLKWQLADTELRVRGRFRGLDLHGHRQTDADLRELTLAWRDTQTALTLGAQQVNWGRMDILRITDLINPVDQQELFYEELTDAKLALWMANLEWQDDTQTVQLLVAPQVAVDRLAATVGGLPVQIDRPGASVDNTTFALRYGAQALGWNADFVAIRGWQTSPSLRQLTDAPGPRLQGTILRQNSLGFSADKALGPMVVRLEGLYATRAPHHPAPGLRARPYAAWGGGLDLHQGPWFFAAQVIAQHDADATNPGDLAFVSAIVQRKWLQDRLIARALHIGETRSGSSWTSLRLTYELSPHLLGQLQGDWFRGEPTEAFGDFRPRSRIAVSLRLQL